MMWIAAVDCEIQNCPAGLSILYLYPNLYLETVALRRARLPS